ncbi:MAG: DUF4143 domain-containing protein, partial [Chloroflexota bacterium]|nr:DUF4143 domain-containing protein [Chloroflexota bacterium]
LYTGFYPRVLDQGLDPSQALADYFETYVERDVRRMGEIRNLSGFRRFARLCAGRTGQMLNLSSLGSDAGVSHTTAREWLSVLERSYVVFLMPPFFANISKRLVKSPKIYFYDVGLAAFLIGIKSAGQVAAHPLRGPLFENAVVMEALKHRANIGLPADLYFYRDKAGLECDLLYETGHGMLALDAKAGATIASDYFRGVNRVAELVPAVSARAVVYGGVQRQLRDGCEVLPLSGLPETLRQFDGDTAPQEAR